MDAKRLIRFKWVGIGSAPLQLRVKNSGSHGASLGINHTFTGLLGGISPVIDNSIPGTYSVAANQFVNVDESSLATYVVKMNATTWGPSYGRFGFGVQSELAELATALRNTADTYHCDTNGEKAVNVGSSYTEWVMDIAMPQSLLLQVDLKNILSGPWDTPYATWTASGSTGIPTNSATSRIVQYEMGPAAWEALSDAPIEKDVNIEVKDYGPSDLPTRTAKIKIRIHNPNEKWKPIGAAAQWWMEPDIYEFTGGKASTMMVDTDGVHFRYRHAYPSLTRAAETITGHPLIQAFDMLPHWVNLIGKVAGIGKSLAEQAEQWQGPYGATFADEWDNPYSTFSPNKDANRMSEYTMTAAAELKYSSQIWICDGYDDTGYSGKVGGSSFKRIPGQHVFGKYKIEAGGGGIGGGGIGVVGGGGN